MSNVINFIDVENTGRRFVPFLLEHAKNERCVVFYTKNSPTISMEDLVSLHPVLHNVEFEKCVTGPNALDMQLVSQLGVFIPNNKTAKYVIISNDHGYDSVVKYWSKRNICIERRDLELKSQTQNELKEKNNSFDVENKTIEKIKKLNEHILDEYKSSITKNDISDKNADEILKIIYNIYNNTSQRKRLNKIYVKMLKNFGQTNGLAYYRIVKPLIPEMFTKISESKKNN